MKFIFSKRYNSYNFLFFLFLLSSCVNVKPYKNEQSLNSKYEKLSVLQSDNVWFNSIKTKSGLPLKKVSRLITYTYQRIRNTKELTILPNIIINDREPRIIFLTLRSGYKKIETVCGRAYGFINAVNNALSKLKQSPYSRNFILKFDIVRNVRKQIAFNIRKNSILDPSLQGIAFSKTSQFAFLSSEILSRELITKKGTIDIENVAEYILSKKLYKKAVGVWAKVATFSTEENIYLFKTDTFFIDNRLKSTRFFRNHGLFYKVSIKKLKKRINKLKGYFMNFPTRKNFFAMQYNKPLGKLNLYSQANAILALLKLYKLENNSRLLIKIENHIDALLHTNKNLDSKSKTLFFMEDIVVDINTNAKILMMLLRYSKVVKKHSYDNYIKRMARYILSQQNKNGSFISQRIFPSAEVVKGKIPVFPSEIILALIDYYEYSAHILFLKRAEKAMKFILLNSQGEKFNRNDFAALAVLNKLFTYTRKKELVVASIKIAEEILNDQNNFPEYLDVMGTFNTNYAVSYTALKINSLICAYTLTKYLKKDDLASDLQDAIYLSILYLFQNQHNKFSTIQLRNSLEYIDGFEYSVFHVGVTLDNSSTVLSALLNTLEFMNIERVQKLIPSTNTFNNLKKMHKILYSK